MPLQLMAGGTAPSGLENGQTGILAPTTRGWTFGNLTPSANRGYLSRFVLSRPLTATSIVVHVTVAALSNDNSDVGIYDATGARLVSAGATAGKLNATGLQTYTIASTNLSAGTVYYAAFAYGAVGSTAATVQGCAFNSFTNAQGFGTTIGLVEMTMKDASYPLPASWGALSNIGSVGIAPWIR